MEGNRPVLAEVQALLTPTAYGNARRSSNGFDYNRAMMLLAVLEKRGGLMVSNCDAYINVIGGLSLDEPAADLADDHRAGVQLPGQKSARLIWWPSARWV